MTRSGQSASRDPVDLHAEQQWLLLRQERDRLREFAEWVAGYDSERQLVGSGVIEHAKGALNG
jgi:hypothetical protein